MQQFKKYFILFLTGGIIYYEIEILWREFSHWSMFLLAGCLFLLIGHINIRFTFAMPLWKQQLIATYIVTTLEFIFGVVLNLWLKLNIWDYSNLSFNLLGQICLLYSVLWFFLSLVAIVLDDWLRFYFFNESKPSYKLF